MLDHDDCKPIRPLLDAYHDGELDISERQHVDVHLGRCEDCRRSLSEIGIVVSSLHRLPSVPLNRDFADLIETKLAEQHACSSDCADIEPRLDAFRDRELDQSEHRIVSDHLALCARCQQALSDIERIVASLSALPKLAPKRDLADDFEKILARKNKVVVRQRAFVWGSFSVAAAVALLAIAWHGTPLAKQSSLAVVPTQIDRGTASVVATANDTAHKQDSQVKKVSLPQIADAGAMQKPPGKSKAGHKNSAVPGGSAVNEVADSDVGRKGNTASNREVQASQSPKKTVAPMTSPDADRLASAAHSGAGGDTVAANGAENSTEPSHVAGPERNSSKEIAQGALIGTKGNTDGVIALYDGEANPAEELGMATDEDGLYALKL